MAAHGRRAVPLILLWLVSACAAGGPVAPPSGAAPSRAPAPDLTLPGAGGRPLAADLWPAAAPRAVILAVHGFGDYGPSTFDAAARYWADRGIATYAYDQRGFGRNPSRGFWPGAEGLVADLRAVARAVRARHPCRPLIVLGHSMGGGVVLAAAAEGLDADALVLAAPAIWGGDALNPLHRLAAWAMAAAVPDRRFTGEGLVEIRPSDNTEVLEALARDPLYLGRPSAREIMGLVRVTDRAADAAPRVAMPALLLLGEKDEIVPNDRVAEIFERIPAERGVIRYPEGWHLLLRDRQAERVWADVAEWSAQREAAMACARGSARSG